MNCKTFWVAALCVATALAQIRQDLSDVVEGMNRNCKATTIVTKTIECNGEVVGKYTTRYDAAAVKTLIITVFVSRLGSAGKTNGFAGTSTI